MFDVRKGFVYRIEEKWNSNIDKNGESKVFEEREKGIRVSGFGDSI